MQIKLSMLVRWSLVLVVLAHLASSVAMGLGRWNEYDWYRLGSLNLAQPLGFFDIFSLTFNAFCSPLITIYPSANGTLQFNWYSYGYESTSDYLAIASFPFGASLLWLVILAVIPTTRRIAKLRTEHIFRAAIIAATSCALLFEFGRIVQGMIMFRQPFLDWYSLVLVICVFFTAIWHFLFWPAAIIIGWKIRPAILLVTLGTIAAFLGAFTLTIIIGLNR